MLGCHQLPQMMSGCISAVRVSTADPISLTKNEQLCYFWSSIKLLNPRKETGKHTQCRLSNNKCDNFSSIIHEHTFSKPNKMLQHPLELELQHKIELWVQKKTRESAKPVILQVPWLMSLNWWFAMINISIKW